MADPDDAATSATNEVIEALSGRVSELTARVGTLEAELSSARRRIQAYETQDDAVQDAVAAALHAAREVRERAERVGEQILAGAREERQALLAEIEELRTRRASLETAPGERAMVEEILGGVLDETLVRLRGRGVVRPGERAATSPAPAAPAAEAPPPRLAVVRPTAPTVAGAPSASTPPAATPSAAAPAAPTQPVTARPAVSPGPAPAAPSTPAAALRVAHAAERIPVTPPPPPEPPPRPAGPRSILVEVHPVRHLAHALAIERRLDALEAVERAYLRDRGAERAGFRLVLRPGISMGDVVAQVAESGELEVLGFVGDALQLRVRPLAALSGDRPPVG